MRRLLTMDHLEGVLRAKVCKDCPHRSRDCEGPDTTTPRACEKTCPLFVHLPVIREVARQADPLVGHRESRLHELLKSVAPGKTDRAKRLRRYSQDIAAAIERLLRG